MITQEQFKLFSNDPKFRKIPKALPNSSNYLATKKAQEIAILKVYAGCRPIRHKEVIMDSMIKKEKPSHTRPTTNLDFLQSRLQAYAQKLINDMDKILNDVEQIKHNHEERQNIRNNINKQLQFILEQSEQIDEIVGDEDEHEIHLVERVVDQIKDLYEANCALKKQNQEIELRIQQKKERIRIQGPKRT